MRLRSKSVLLCHSILYISTIQAQMLTNFNIKCSERSGSPLDISKVLGQSVPATVTDCIALVCDKGEVIASPKSKWCIDNPPTLENQKNDHTSNIPEAEITTTTQSTTVSTVVTTMATPSTRWPRKMTMPPRPLFYSTTPEEPMDYASDHINEDGEDSYSDDQASNEDNWILNPYEINEETFKVTETTTPTETTTMATTTPTTTIPTTTTTTAPTIIRTRTRPTFQTSTTSRTTTTSPPLSSSISPDISSFRFVEPINEVAANTPIRKKIPKVKSTKKIPKRIVVRKHPRTDFGASVAEVRESEDNSSQYAKYFIISLPGMLILILVSLAIFLLLIIISCTAFCLKKLLFRKKEMRVVVAPQTPRTCLSNYNFEV